MTRWLIHFHICFTELKIYHLSFFHRFVVVVVVVNKCIKLVFTYGFRTRFGNFLPGRLLSSSPTGPIEEAKIAKIWKLVCSRTSPVSRKQVSRWRRLMNFLVVSAFFSFYAVEIVMEKLSDEILVRIFSFLSARDLCRCSQVCNVAQFREKMLDVRMLFCQAAGGGREVYEFVYLQFFLIRIVFNFSWVLHSSQEKAKTMFVLNFVG